MQFIPEVKNLHKMFSTWMIVITFVLAGLYEYTDMLKDILPPYWYQVALMAIFVARIVNQGIATGTLTASDESSK